MVTGWVDLFRSCSRRRKNLKEFVSVDARLDDFKKDTRSYEMLSRDSGKTMDDIITPPVVTHISPAALSPLGLSGRRTPDYFGQTAYYHTPARSFSSPRPPQAAWDASETFASPTPTPNSYDEMNPLGMNRI